MAIYGTSGLLATFSASALSGLLTAGDHPTGHFSNPNAGGSIGTGSGFPYAYVNLTLSDPDATFTRVVFGGAANFEFDNITVSAGRDSSVPEPGSLALFAAGIGGLFAARRRKQRA